MRARPLSVTIVGWFLIVSGILSLASVPIALNNPLTRAALENGPLPFAFQIGWSIGTAILTLVCGWFILKGANWARILYIAASVAGLAITLATGRVTTLVLIAAGLLAVIAFILFRRPANDFFAGRPGEPALPDVPPTL